MSNFIVPNTFVPGTKAKAQEVNENFTSIQNELNLKAEKGGNSAQVFSVANATENSHAVNKSQLEDAINTTSNSLNGIISKIGNPFTIERAYTDSNGNPAYMTSSGGELSFLVNDTNYGPIVALPANNLPRFSINSVNSVNLSGYSDGTYNIFLKSDGTAYVYNNTIYTQNGTPLSPVVNSIFVNTSVLPITAKIYQNSSWVDFDDVYLGSVTISENVITNIKPVNFNDNNFNVNKLNTTTLKKSYVNGTSGYRVYSDGFCEQWGYGTSTNQSKTFTFLKTFADTKYNIETCFKGESAAHYAAVVTSYSTTSITIYQYAYANSSYKIGVFWKASGYLATGQY